MSSIQHTHIRGINRFIGVFAYTPRIKVNVCLTTDSSGWRLGGMWPRPKKRNPGPDTQAVTDVGFLSPSSTLLFYPLAFISVSSPLWNLLGVHGDVCWCWAWLQRAPATKYSSCVLSMERLSSWLTQSCYFLLFMMFHCCRWSSITPTAVFQLHLPSVRQ